MSIRSIRPLAGGQLAFSRMINPNILIVDDDVDQQRILARILKPAGYRLLRAGSAEEARQALHAKLPDAAILDWNMPGASGLELARELRADPRFSRLIVLILTVNALPEYEIKALREGGANAFLTKPVDADELLARLRALLRRRDQAA